MEGTSARRRHPSMVIPGVVALMLLSGIVSVPAGSHFAPRSPVDPPDGGPAAAAGKATTSLWPMSRGATSVDAQPTAEAGHGGQATPGASRSRLDARGSAVGPDGFVTGEVVITVPVGPGPYNSAYDSGSGDMYVADARSDSVSVIAGASNTIVGSPIPVGNIPTGVAYDSGSGDVYVVNQGSNNVSVISGDSVVGSPITVGTSPFGVAYDSGNGDVYVANRGSDTVSEISGVTVVNTIPVGTSPEEVAYDSVNGDVYVSDPGPNTVNVISGNGVVGGPITVGANPVGLAFDSSNGDVYVANYLSDNVSVISGHSVVGSAISVGVDPAGVGYDSGNEEVYVANEGSNTVNVISGTTNALVGGAISVGRAPFGVDYDPRNGDMYVANSESASVSVISTRLALGPLGASLRGTSVSGTASATISVGSDPSWAAYDPDNGDVFVANSGSDSVSVISGDSAVGSPIAVGANPTGLAYDASNGDVYVANSGSDNVSIISGATDTVVGSSITVGANPSGVTYDPGNGDVYVANSGSDNVSVISGATDLLVGSGIPVGISPLGVAYDSGNGFLYVANSGSDNVSVISGATDTLVGSSITVGASPSGVTYDPGNGDVYVANSGSDKVSVISGATDLLVGTAIPVGTSPFGLAYDSGNGDVYVSNSGSDDVSVVSGVTNQVVGPAIPVGSDPLDLAYDFENGGLFVVNSGSLDVGSISTLVSTSNFAGLGADVGQEVFLSAPLIGEGAGDDTLYIDVSPSTGLGCVANPAGFTVLSGACPAEVPGTYNVNFTVVDGAGDAVWTSATFAVYVDPTELPPVPSPGSVDSGQSVTFTPSVSGGSGGGSYAWTYGALTGCTAPSAPSLNCTPTGPGSFTVSYAWTDSDNVVATGSTMVGFTVYPDPTVAPPRVSRATVDVGQSVTFFAVGSGGSGGLTYAWNDLPAGCPGAAAIVTCNPTEPVTNASISVTVTDSNGFDVTSSAVNFTVYADPTVWALAASPSSAVEGSNVTFDARATIGSGDLVYSWSGLPAGCASADAATVTCVPTAPGTYQIVVNVTDSNGVQATSSALSFTVSPVPAPSPALGGFTLWGSLVAGVVVVGAVAAVLWVRRPRPTPSTPDTTSPPPDPSLPPTEEY